MYVPTADDRVRVLLADGWTPGVATGISGPYDEHFVVECDDGRTVRVHKEDITGESA